MTLFGNRKDRDPIAVQNSVAPPEVDVTTEQARIAQAVVIVDETLEGDRSDARRLTNALLEVRHALAPSTKPLVPVVPGGAS